MAELMSYFNRDADQDLTILVATSGDTGGAVAAGFYQTPGIEVVILYPSGKVSPLQEKQLTTLGHNVRAIEVDGTFDDCQTLVKQAFLDEKLTHKKRLSSANSINIARLIPQSFYYFEAYRQLLAEEDLPISFVVPSGNFGNLTAGLFARRMGLPIEHMVAATNINDVVPRYLQSGKYEPKPSHRTLSNAMDVGNPSNFARMENYFTEAESSTWNNMCEHIQGYAYTDVQTEETMRKVEQELNYILDPHGAVGYRAMNDYLTNHPDHRAVLLETAHPAKFLEDVERILGHEIEVPERLASLRDKSKVATEMKPTYEDLKHYLLS